MSSRLILAIDDQSENLAILDDLLSSRGYDVAIAKNGEDALVRAERLNPSLILLDVMMPGMDGFETCERLKENDATRGIPVIFLTALESEDEKVRGFRKGAVDYITKPFLQEELLARVQVHLNAQAMLSVLRRENQKLIDEIHHRKQAEEMLIRSERFAAVGTLVQGVAHEFNNISSSLRGYAELALERYGHVDGELKMLLERIFANVERQSKVINNLLSVSGKDKSEKVLVDPTTILLDAVELAKVKSKSIHVEERWESDYDIFVDPHQIEQVILNLLINAYDAVIDEPHPKIVVLAGPVSTQEYMISVSDNGCGIAQEDANKIFTPFYSTKGEFAKGDVGQAKLKGNGLGLSVCHRIIERHGGRFECDSREGEGTTFRFFLPRMAIEGENGHLERVDMNEGGAPKIESGESYVLVVEDDEELSVLLQKKIEWDGWNVKVAPHGRTALDLIQKAKPRLMLLDLNMPVMGGRELLEELRRQGIKINCIAMSALMTDATRKELKGMGCDDVWSKPIDLHHLGKKIEGYFSV